MRPRLQSKCPTASGVAGAWRVLAVINMAGDAAIIIAAIAGAAVLGSVLGGTIMWSIKDATQDRQLVKTESLRDIMREQQQLRRELEKVAK